MFFMGAMPGGAVPVKSGYVMVVGARYLKNYGF